MSFDTQHIKKLLFICLLTNGLKIYSQDTKINYTLDTTLLNFNYLTGLIFTKFQMPFDYLYRSPSDKDKKIFKSYTYLTTQKPTSKNYDKYYNLACSLWELNRLKEAEQMFLNIISSSEKHYSTTYYHSSDIPGDTTVNSYGYGSYTSSYKNSAAIYLTKIYIEQKKFDKAFKYLENATKNYKVTYTCGTGYHRQKDECDFLYACCYEGLKKYDNVLELLLPECLNRNDEIIVRVIKKLYTPDKIKEYLLKAENSIQCLLDTFPSYSYQTTYSSGNNSEKTDTLTYYSGSATINLFDKTIDMPTPNLENGERITKEHFIKEFKESNFYTELANMARLSQHTTGDFLLLTKSTNRRDIEIKGNFANAE